MEASLGKQFVPTLLGPRTNRAQIPRLSNYQPEIGV